MAEVVGGDAGTGQGRGGCEVFARDEARCWREVGVMALRGAQGTGWGERRKTGRR